MTARESFEHKANALHWYLKRSDKSYYLTEHVEWAWIGFCLALGLDHTKE